MDIDSNNHLLESDTPAQAAEYLRLSIAILNKHQLAATPVTYGLFYTYVSGKNLQLNVKLDELLAQKSVSHDDLSKLFIRYFFKCGDEILDNIRNELIGTVAEAIGTLVDIAGKSAISNQELEKHISNLATCQNSHDILSTVSSILQETRHFVDDSKRLEEDLIVSSKGLQTLKSELANARIEASTDALTGLNNRRGFDIQLKKLLNDRRHNGNGFSTIMADMDNFKEINDTFGHLVGDKVLKAFSQILKGKTRETDYAARYGGEEFVLLLPDTSLDNAYIVAENIRSSIEKLRVTQIRTGENIGKITASFGVAVHKPGESASEVIDRCDKALYQAKKIGRNRTIRAE